MTPRKKKKKDPAPETENAAAAKAATVDGAGAVADEEDVAAWRDLENQLHLLVPLEEAVGATVALAVISAFVLAFGAVGKWVHRPPPEPLPDAE